LVEKDNVIDHPPVVACKIHARNCTLQRLAIIGGILTDYQWQFATLFIKPCFNAFAGACAVFLHRSRKELAKTTVLLYSAVY